MSDTLDSSYPSNFNLDFVDEDDDELMLNGGGAATQDSVFGYGQDFTMPTQASQRKFLIIYICWINVQLNIISS